MLKLMDILDATSIPVNYRMAFIINFYREPLLRRMERETGMIRPVSRSTMSATARPLGRFQARSESPIARMRGGSGPSVTSCAQPASASPRQSRSRARQGPPRGKGKLAPHQAFLEELVAQDPDITLFELRDALADAEGVQVHHSSIANLLSRLGFTYKKSRWLRPNVAAPR